MKTRPLEAQGLSAFLAVLAVRVARVPHLLRDRRRVDVGHRRCPRFPIFSFANLGFPTADA
eukprot:3934203-Lingulodinium_polyedra.AAC.1